MKVETIDLNFLGTEKVIASFLLLGEGSAAIVETGPTSCLDHLRGGLEANGVSPGDVREVFLTHIHLDHAGATGVLVRRFPELAVYVHERGAPHLADPTKLLKSARQLYGDDMDRLWGEVAAGPADNINELSGGRAF